MIAAQSSDSPDDRVCFTCEQPLCSCTDAQWAAGGQIEKPEVHIPAIAEPEEANRGE